ncbi:hypothetical protein Zm00014a_027952 [Zea mays]|uniref:Uncharacterized protein n=1 Tax=Zea mays TaxID=4577 RepID=A0A3L6DQK0_MAIZE|nr:hypothetical protein Zm00014a_027952 [Zea mays]
MEAKSKHLGTSDKILSKMGEGLGFLQSVVSSSVGYLRYYSNEEGYELDFCSIRKYNDAAMIEIDVLNRLAENEKYRSLSFVLYPSSDCFFCSTTNMLHMVGRGLEVKPGPTVKVSVLSSSTSRDNNFSMLVKDSRHDFGTIWKKLVGALLYGEKVKLENEQMWLFMDDNIKKPATCNLILRNLPPAT